MSSIAMQKTHNYRTNDTDTMSQFMLCAPCIGYLAGTNGRGDVLVEFDDSGPKTARLVARLSKNELGKEDYRGRKVLLLFERGNPDYPIIVDLMADPVENLLSLVICEDKQETPKEALIDGKRLTIEAEDEIILKCGVGSITLRKDGKMVLKGTHITSRAKGLNKIKGSAVRIN